MYLENAKDKICIELLEVYAYHGVFPEEKQKGQPFLINAVLYADIRKAGKEDRLELSTDYGEVCQFMTQWMQENTFNLIEAVAEAPIEQPFGCVSVKIHREWHKAYLGVGSNMGDKKHYIQEAVEALKSHPLTVVNGISDLIETEPYGGVVQDNFLNGVIEIETLLTPMELLDMLHEIEGAAGRVREVHWGPRTLDLDIIFYDKIVYEDDALIIPHQDMENRRFVLEPLKMLAPNYRHPVLGKTVSRLLEDILSKEEPKG